MLHPGLEIYRLMFMRQNTSRELWGVKWLLLWTMAHHIHVGPLSRDHMDSASHPCTEKTPSTFQRMTEKEDQFLNTKLKVGAI